MALAAKYFAKMKLPIILKITDIILSPIKIRITNLTGNPA
jgi:hypothetical protein